MSKSICNILVFFLRLNGNVIFITFSMIVVVSHWTVKSLLLPFDNVFELRLLVPGSIGNKSILILESPNRLFENISSLETNIGELIFRFNKAISVKVRINSWNSLLIWSIQLGDGVPNFLLNPKIMFELINNPIILYDFSFIMVLIEFALHVFG